MEQLPGAGSSEGEEFEHTRMTLREHLEELRTRLWRGTAAVLVCFVVCYAFYKDITKALWQPHYDAVAMLNADLIEDVQADVAAGDAQAQDWFIPDKDPPELLPHRRYNAKLQGTHPSESFIFALMTCLYVAAFIGSPVLLWQVWGFVAAGLYVKERKAITRYFPLSVLLFVGGVLFGYFVMMPYAMYFLGSVFNFVDVENNYKVSEYASLLFSLCLALGVVFQLPVIILVFARIGLVEPKTLGKYRGHFAVGAFIIAAMLTPPDPVTQSLMAVPMILLYEFGILLAKMFGKPRELPPASADMA